MSSDPMRTARPDWKKLLRERAALVEDELARVYAGGDEPSRLAEAARYSLLAGGKRLRPVLCLACARVCEPDGGAALDAAVLPFAVGLEMIHTYSLIHDDLPAMDNDTLRRGRPTNHVVYGEAMAILAGDALLTHAFAHMARAAQANPEHALRHLRAIGRVAEAAGLTGMVAGQALDVLCEKQGADPARREEQLHFIHKNKTAAMIRGALLAGAEIGGASERELTALSRYGAALGLAFQVADDILDATSTTEEMGKTVGKDEKEGKLTYVALYGVDGARQRLDSLTEEAVREVQPVDADGFFSDLARDFAARKH